MEKIISRIFTVINKYKLLLPAMYIQNRRDISKFNSCSPLQLCNGLISPSLHSHTLHLLTVMFRNKQGIV